MPVSYRDLLEQLRAYGSWLRGEGLPTDRGLYRDLCGRLEEIIAAFDRREVPVLIDSTTRAEAAWTLAEAVGLEGILRRMSSGRIAGCAGTLQKALSAEGDYFSIPASLHDEDPAGKGRKARDHLFEALTAAHLSRVDSGVSCSEPDVLATLAGQAIAIACKRPFSWNALVDRLEGNSGAIEQTKRAKGRLGIISLEVGHILFEGMAAPVTALSRCHALRRLLAGQRILVKRIDKEILTADRASHVCLVALHAYIPVTYPLGGLDRVAGTSFLMRARGMDQIKVLLRKAYSDL